MVEGRPCLETLVSKLPDILVHFQIAGGWVVRLDFSMSFPILIEGVWSVSIPDQISKPWLIHVIMITPQKDHLETR